jgi:hypothetical protein
VAAEGRSGGGRRALGRVVLVSLAERARTELDERRARGQRLRAHRALRRLEELEQALERFDRGEPPLPAPWYLRRGSLAVAAALLIATAAALTSAVVMHGPSGIVVGVADIAMLLATLVWFAVAVARRPPREGATVPPPNEGSSAENPGR